jgi:hypothetical protein
MSWHHRENVTLEKARILERYFGNQILLILPIRWRPTNIAVSAKIKGAVAAHGRRRTRHVRQISRHLAAAGPSRAATTTGTNGHKGKRCIAWRCPGPSPSSPRQPGSSAVTWPQQPQSLTAFTRWQRVKIWEPFYVGGAALPSTRLIATLSDPIGYPRSPVSDGLTHRTSPGRLTYRTLASLTPMRQLVSRCYRFESEPQWSAASAVPSCADLGCRPQVLRELRAACSVGTSQAPAAQSGGSATGNKSSCRAKNSSRVMRPPVEARARFRRLIMIGPLLVI